jgi:hypothetical protein
MVPDATPATYLYVVAALALLGFFASGYVPSRWFGGIHPFSVMLMLLGIFLGSAGLATLLFVKSLKAKSRS